MNSHFSFSLLADNLEWTSSTLSPDPHVYVSQNSLNSMSRQQLNATQQQHVAASSVQQHNRGSMYSTSSVHSQIEHDSLVASNMSINSLTATDHLGRTKRLPPYRQSPEYSMAVLRDRRRMSSNLDNNGMTASSPSSSSLAISTYSHFSCCSAGVFRTTWRSFKEQTPLAKML